MKGEQSPDENLAGFPVDPSANKPLDCKPAMQPGQIGSDPRRNVGTRYGCDLVRGNH